MTIRRVSAGTGYRYLLQSVAAGDGQRAASTPMTRYYAEAGTPPGRWMGAGLVGLDAGLGVPAGSVVTEEQLFRLMGLGVDPVSGEPLGRAPNRAGSARAAVAGFDLTFSVPKSLSALWAVADARSQELIVTAHHAAIDDALAYAEREIFHTRTGVNGAAQTGVRGVIAAGFDHWDSRANDPHLHTHVVVANRVQAGDGSWRTLDSRALFRAVVALSELHQALVMDRVSDVLGIGWDARARRHSPVPQYEISGVPDALRAEFSSRSSAIEVEKNRLVASYRRAHGHDPSAAVVLRLRQQATLSTRDDKHVHSLAELTAGWRVRAAWIVGDDTIGWAVSVRGSRRVAVTAGGVSAEVVQQVAEAALSAVGQRRATFNRWNVAAEVHRLLQPMRLATAADRLVVADRATDSALGLAVLVSAPELAHTPEAFRRADGSSRFRHRGAERYTTAAILAAEDRLLAAGRDGRAPVAAGASLTEPGGLCEDQAAVVAQIAGSGRVVDLLVGAAGTGKTTALSGLLAVWQREFGPGSVVGLAPSATAADVLGAELGIPSENTAKWLTEVARHPERVERIHQLRGLLERHRGDDRRVRRLSDQIRALDAAVAQWQPRRGQLVIVDEASLASTPALDAIVGRVRAAGGKVLLVGDPAQLSAVEAGGAFDLLVRDRAVKDVVPELVDIHRFVHRWEKQASTRLRSGDPGVIDIYSQQDRIHDGDAGVMLDRAYTAWADDRTQGLRSLLIAADSDTVGALNRRAHDDLVAAGVVDGHGVVLHDGTVVAAGDVITTRRNDRTLSTGLGWVKNGDQWRVQAANADGSLAVERVGGSRRIVLPAEYVGEHVELGYATTVQRAQGLSVDTAHAIVTGPGMTREALYVAMTRARHANHAYVATDHDPDPDTAHIPTEPQDAGSVLTAVLANVGADLSAHETIRAEQEAAGSWAQLVAEYDTIAAAAQHERWRRLIEAALPEGSDQVAASPALPALMTAMRRADAYGLDIDAAFPQLVAARELHSAEDVASVLHQRVERWTARAAPSVRGVRLIAGLHPEARGVNGPDVRRGLDERAQLLEQRAQALAVAALEDRSAWTRALGPLPEEPARRERVLRAATTVAAFRDKWGLTGDAPLGPDRPSDLAYTADRSIVARAIAAVGSPSAGRTAETPDLTVPVTREGPAL